MPYRKIFLEELTAVDSHQNFIPKQQLSRLLIRAFLGGEDFPMANNSICGSRSLWPTIRLIANCPTGITATAGCTCTALWGILALHRGGPAAIFTAIPSSWAARTANRLSDSSTETSAVQRAWRPTTARQGTQLPGGNGGTGSAGPNFT